MAPRRVVNADARAAQIERLSDKDVKTPIDQVDEGHDKFEGDFDGKFKGFTLRGASGEVRVPAR
jgi:hypothetical protein